MGSMSLEDAITRAGSPVELLRQSTARPHAFPVAPEFTNWRTEQNAWRTSCVLFDQSHHMTDLFLSGPDALGLLSQFGVNSFAGFGPGKAKQYVAVNAGGQFIGDAILFHLEDDLSDVVGHPTVAAGARSARVVPAAPPPAHDHGNLAAYKLSEFHEKRNLWR